MPIDQAKIDAYREQLLNGIHPGDKPVVLSEAERQHVLDEATRDTQDFLDGREDNPIRLTAEEAKEIYEVLFDVMYLDAGHDGKKCYFCPSSHVDGESPPGLDQFEHEPDCRWTLSNFWKRNLRLLINEAEGI